MESVKIKALRAVMGRRFRLGAFQMLPFAFYICAAILFVFAAVTAVFGFADIFDELNPFASDKNDILTPLFSVLFCLDGIFLLICGASVSFYAGARVFSSVTGTSPNNKSLLSVRIGIRYMLTKLTADIKITGKSLILLLPVGCNVLILFLWLKYAGLSKASLLSGAVLTGISLLFCLVWISVVCRKYEPAAFVLWQNPMMKPQNAVNAAVLLSEGKTGRLMLRQIMNLPLRLCCLLVFPCLWFLPYIAACRGVIYADDSDVSN